MPSHAFAIHLPALIEPLTTQVLGEAEQSACAANDSGMTATHVPNMPGVKPTGELSVADDGGPISARSHDGLPYDGDLLSDVLEYRTLRHRFLRQELREIDEPRLADLEEMLRDRQDADDGLTSLRAFHRYECSFSTSVKIVPENDTSRDLEIQVADMSAGGLKAESEHEVAPGLLAFVVLPVSGRDVTFPARVAWVRRGCFGLMFAGAAREAPGQQATIQETPQKPDLP